MDRKLILSFDNQENGSFIKIIILEPSFNHQTYTIEPTLNVQYTVKSFIATFDFDIFYI